MAGQEIVSGNVGGIAGQVRAYVTDLKDGSPTKVALAASHLRVLVGDSAGKVRARLRTRAIIVGVSLKSERKKICATAKASLGRSPLRRLDLCSFQQEERKKRARPVPHVDFVRRD